MNGAARINGSVVEWTATCAICATGMFRTLQDAKVQRALRATFHAFATADVYTVIGVRNDLESFKGSLGSRVTVSDVRSAFASVISPGQSIVHRELTEEEELWSRCNSTMVSMYYKWALCWHTVAVEQRKRRRAYDWVLRMRTDLMWGSDQDQWLWLRPPTDKRAVYTGRDSAMSDWFIFVPGIHIECLLDLPNAPCECGGDRETWGMWKSYLAHHGFTRLMLEEGRLVRGQADRGFPWPMQVVRTPFALHAARYIRTREEHNNSLNRDWIYKATGAELAQRMLETGDIGNRTADAATAVLGESSILGARPRVHLGKEQVFRPSWRELREAGPALDESEKCGVGGLKCTVPPVCC